jgi:hypothetical protein
VVYDFDVFAAAVAFAFPPRPFAAPFLGAAAVALALALAIIQLIKKSSSIILYSD